MKKDSLIRTIYLYTFALLGLILITIGTVGFIRMALKTFVFTQADQQQKVYNLRTPNMPLSIDKVAETNEKDEPIKTKEAMQLTETEQKALTNWIADYNKWREESEKVDFVKSRRHENAANNLALILIGIPLYLYHWRIIKKETKKSA